jgi:cytoskeletal protein RodZ
LTEAGVANIPGGEFDVSDLGQLLKKARLEKGISLEQLEEMTKIRKRYLEAIEEGDYNVLPGNFYVRAFIKNYAEAVGLDPNEVLTFYGNAIPPARLEGDIEPVRRSRKIRRNNKAWSKWASNILMLLFVLLILGIIYYFINTTYVGNSNGNMEGEKITDRTAQGTGDATPVPNDNASGQSPGQGQSGPAVPPPAQEETKKQPSVSLVKTANNVDYYVVENADNITVQLKVNGEECWVRIDKIVPATAEKKQERQIIEQKLFKKGDTREWTSDKSVYIIVGFPPAAELTINGISIDIGQEKGRKDIQIDLSNPT